MDVPLPSRIPPTPRYGMPQALANVPDAEIVWAALYGVAYEAQMLKVLDTCKARASMLSMDVSITIEHGPEPVMVLEGDEAACQAFADTCGDILAFVEPTAVIAELRPRVASYLFELWCHVADAYQRVIMDQVGMEADR